MRALQPVTRLRPWIGEPHPAPPAAARRPRGVLVAAAALPLVLLSSGRGRAQLLWVPRAAPAASARPPAVVVVRPATLNPQLSTGPRGRLVRPGSGILSPPEPAHAVLGADRDRDGQW